METSAEPSAETPHPLDGGIATLTNGSQSHNLTRSPTHTPVTENKLGKRSDGRRGLGTPRICQQKFATFNWRAHATTINSSPVARGGRELRDNRELQILRRELLQVLRAREPTSFWRENVIAVVILLRVLARISQLREQFIKFQKFNHYATGKRLNPLQQK